MAALLLGLIAALAGATCTSTREGAPSTPPGAQPAAPFSLRDPRQGLARGRLTPRQGRLLDSGMQALRAHDLGMAEKRFRTGREAGETRAPFELGVVYVALASGRWGDAKERLQGLLSEAPDYAAALEARSELHAAEGETLEAFDGFRALLRLLPEDPRVASRLQGLRGALVDVRSEEAWKALEDGDLDRARRTALSLVEIDPSSPAGFEVLSETAEAGGKLEDAWVWAQKAHAVAPEDDVWTEALAELAMKTGRFGEATALFDALAAGEPAYRERADKARFEFQTRNLPAIAQPAARSMRISRAHFADLAWALVPEVRDASVPSAPDVAIDVVDRTDRTQLVRAIALGFFTVSRDTHRVEAEQTLTRSDLAGLLQRLAIFVAQGRPLPPCLSTEPASATALAECGILSASPTRAVSGREAIRALERAARAGREGSP